MGQAQMRGGDARSGAGGGGGGERLAGLQISAFSIAGSIKNFPHLEK